MSIPLTGWCGILIVASFLCQRVPCTVLKKVCLTNPLRWILYPCMPRRKSLANRYWGIPPSISVLEHCFGLGDSYSRIRLDLVLNLLTTKAVLYKKISVYGGSQYRPLLHVHDVAGAVLANIDTELTGPYNLHFKNMTISEIADRISFHVRGAVVKKTELKFQDARNYRVSSDKARQAFGFSPAPERGRRHPRDQGCHRKWSDQGCQLAALFQRRLPAPDAHAAFRSARSGNDVAGLQGPKLIRTKRNASMTEFPKLMKGGLAVDDRGEVAFVNEFDFAGVKRFLHRFQPLPGFRPGLAMGIGGRRSMSPRSTAPFWSVVSRSTTGTHRRPIPRFIVSCCRIARRRSGPHSAGICQWFHVAVRGWPG